MCSCWIYFLVSLKFIEWKELWNNSKQFFISVLSSFIPVLRNRIDGAEYLIGGAISGTLAGYLFNDPIGLGFLKKKYTERNLYKRLCIIKGFSYGTVLGLGISILNRFSNRGSLESQLREWEDFWKRKHTVSFHFTLINLILIIIYWHFPNGIHLYISFYRKTMTL